MATHLLSPPTHFQTSIKMALHAPFLLAPSVSSTTLPLSSFSEVFSVKLDLVGGILRAWFIVFEKAFVLMKLIVSRETMLIELME